MEDTHSRISRYFHRLRATANSPVSTPHITPAKGNIQRTEIIGHNRTRTALHPHMEKSLRCPLILRDHSHCWSQLFRKHSANRLWHGRGSPRKMLYICETSSPATENGNSRNPPILPYILMISALLTYMSAQRTVSRVLTGRTGLTHGHICAVQAHGSFLWSAVGISILKPSEYSL